MYLWIYLGGRLVVSNVPSPLLWRPLSLRLAWVGLWFCWILFVHGGLRLFLFWSCRQRFPFVPSPDDLTPRRICFYFWNQDYQQTKPKMGWDFERSTLTTPRLKIFLKRTQIKQIKLQQSRVEANAKLSKHHECATYLHFVHVVCLNQELDDFPVFG